MIYDLDVFLADVSMLAKFTGQTYGGMYVLNETFFDTDFEGIALNDCVFKGCNFSGCDLSTAVLNNCSFEDCDFSGADLSSILVNDSHFTSCNLNKATFEAADISDTYFYNCAGAADFANAELFKSNFVYCDLEQTDFSGVTFKEIDFYDVELAGCYFTEWSTFRKVIIQESGITGVNFTAVRGYEPSMLRECRAFPYITTGTAKYPELAPSDIYDGEDAMSDTDWSRLDHSKYSKTAVAPRRIAHLYCSDVAEFGSLQ